MSEKPEEQAEQQEVEGHAPSGDPASPQDPPAQADSPSTPASENGSSDNHVSDNQVSADPASDNTSAEESPTEAQLAETGSAETEPTEAEVGTSESSPEMPAADASATVADAIEADAAESEQPDPPKKPKSRSAKVKPIEEIPSEELEEAEDLERDWYILKVQSNREKSIRDALERRVKVAGLERFFGDVIVPTEDVAEYKNGKRKVTKRKLWPGYIVVNMAINDDTWFLVRETPGIGDFTGSIGKPSPMLPHEVERIIPKEAEETDEPQQIKVGIRFKPGDRVRVKDGYFQNFEGDVESIDEANGRVTVICSIFGRSTPVELEHWQIEDI